MMRPKNNLVHSEEPPVHKRAHPAGQYGNPSSFPFVFLLVLINLAGSVCPAAAGTPAARTKTQASTGSDSAPAAPSITSQPISQSVNPGQTATFNVGATGTAPLTYQWMRNGTVIPGATSPAYTTPAAAVEENGAQFSVTISNPIGNATSSSATLTVNVVLQSEQLTPSASGQTQRARTSRFLSNSYVGLEIGSIGYSFSNAQLQPGFQAQSVQVPHLATRFVLLGHEFNKYFSGQVSELISSHPVVYQNVNGDLGSHDLWMNNIAGFTVKGRLPLGKRWSLFGEGGLGVVARNGFTVKQSTALNSANYATFLFGGGLDYRFNDHWDLPTGVIVAPGQAAGKQPTAVFFSGGFNYTMRRVPAEPAEEDSRNGPLWPKNIVQIGYITDALGFGVNDFFSKGKVSIFWHGSIEIRSGLSVNYQRNLFHTRRFFAIDWGADVSSWKSRINGERFYTASVYPVLRIPLIRTNPVEFYFSYSLAGPSLITTTNVDNQKIGKLFTFQDYMSTGFYLGRKRRVTGEVRIAHYSNANLFTQNPGLTIPLGFYFGSTF
jgi:lipid A 3-O-deacylase PagL/Ig-like domain-containing protein/outer membrane protein with beta-barrel domain